jgi:hypothetical protein
VRKVELVRAGEAGTVNSAVNENGMAIEKSAGNTHRTNSR